MGLIDAGDLTKNMMQYFQGKKTIGQIIDEQPTAFDVDKVVEQLEKEKQTSASAKTEAIIGMCGASANHYSGEAYAYQKAIDIVKAGGIDGN